MVRAARDETMGVWAVVSGSGTRQREAWFLAHVARDGKHAVSPKTAVNELNGGGELVAILDYDGDGLPEAVTRTFELTDAAGGSTQSFRVWTLKAGTIRPYAGQGKLTIVDLVDQDEDGLLDWVVDPSGVVIGTSGGWSRGLRDWTILAHVKKDGSYSITDEVAQSYARALCPSAPAPDAFARSDRCYAGIVHCARLWGRSTEAIEGPLRVACKDAPLHNVCHDSLAALLFLAAAVPPFVLSAK